MGSTRVILPNKEQLKTFVIDLLKDVEALEKMLDQDVFEKEPIRIGAEQEMCLVDENWKPAMMNMEVLNMAKNRADFTTELARFNLEANVEPLVFKGDCLSKMETNILEAVQTLDACAQQSNARILLTGILPTVRKTDLDIDTCLTPFERYRALCDGITKMRGTSHLELNIHGIDELLTKQDTPLIEGCNTGFQVHLQVTPQEFAQKYNIAQAIAGPALAVATNSPLLFSKRLWHETRIALFQQSIDVRLSGDHLRHRSPRVMFGNQWVDESILEIYKEDIMRFRVLLSSTLKEDSLEKLAKGEMPHLYALLIHNSTVYRWNRPCYGLVGGVPHLRIENRVLPSGPTVKDEMANAALWLGLLNGMNEKYPDIRKHLEFSDAQSNFLAGARYGMNTQFFWPPLAKGKSISLKELLSKELLPIARVGLQKAQVDTQDIDHYLGIIEERVQIGQNGSQWILNSFAGLLKETSVEETTTVITAAIHKRQQDNTPVHKWALASMDDIDRWQPSELVVEEFMQTDLFTVREDDIIELAAKIMDWQKLHYVLIENNQDELVGLITSRTIRKHLMKRVLSEEIAKEKKVASITVGELMIKNPPTIAPAASITKAIELMQQHKVGCLPVVKNGKLLGVITEQDFLKVSGQLTYRFFKTRNPTKK